MVTPPMQFLKECINLRPQHICQCKMNKFHCQSKMQILVRDLRALAALTANTTHMYSPATCLHLFIHIYVLSCLLLTFSVLCDTPLDQLTVRSLPYCLSTVYLHFVFATLFNTSGQIARFSSGLQIMSQF